MAIGVIQQKCQIFYYYRQHFAYFSVAYPFMDIYFAVIATVRSLLERFGYCFSFMGYAFCRSAQIAQPRGYEGYLCRVSMC